MIAETGLAVWVHWLAADKQGSHSRTLAVYVNNKY
jgi:hypothetical protein